MQCPSCKLVDCAEGRARCWDCLEDEMRALTRYNRRMFFRWMDSRVQNVIRRFGRPMRDKADRVLVENWLLKPENGGGAYLRGQRKRPTTLKRNQHYGARA